MATDPAAPKDQKDPAKAPRKPGKFVVCARVVGTTAWEELPSKYEAITGEQAKKAAAEAIYAGADGPLKEAIVEGGPGVQLQAVSDRMWHAVTIKVEPQKPKLNIG